MSCCYTDLGLVPHNENIKTEILATIDGEYVFRLNYLGSIIYKKQVAESGDELIVPMPFNEDKQYELTILNPDGDPVVNPANENCDKWIFRTFIAIKENCNGDNECDDVVDLGDHPYS